MKPFYLNEINRSSLYSFVLFLMMYNNAVKSDALKWLPNGSELVKESRNATSDSLSKPETYTYFGCSQETVPEFVKNPIIPKYPDIIIAKLGPGQVYFTCFCLFQKLLIKHVKIVDHALGLEKITS